MGNIRLKALVLLLLFYCSGCVTSSDFSAENMELIQSYWALYLKRSPEWPETKKKWRALGQEETRALVTLLVRDAQVKALHPTKDTLGNVEPGWQRAVDELTDLGLEAVQPLIKAIAQLKDETVVPPCLLALSQVATGEDLKTAFLTEVGEDQVTFRCRLVRTMALRQEETATDFLLAVLQGPYDWQVRATTVDVLGNYEGPLMGRIISALEQARQDADAFVKDKAEQALEKLSKVRSEG